MSRLKRGSVGFCVGLVLSGAQTPPPASNQEQPPASSLMRTGDGTDVPLLDLAGVRSGHPEVEVMLNGQGPFRMAVDTGFPKGQVALFTPAARALSLRPAGTVNTGDGGGKQAPAVPVYRLESVKIGGLNFSGVRAMEVPIGNAPPNERPTFDGVLGMAMFKDLLLSIDYKNKRVKASPGVLPEPDGRTIFEYEPGPGGLVKVPLWIGGKDISAVLDTGNGRHPRFVPEALIADLPTRGEARDAGPARTVSQQIRTKTIALNAPVMLGSAILPIQEVSYPAPSHANLGSLALKGMTVTLDQKNNRVRIAPSPDRPDSTS